jgi:hypothetical protein
MRMEVRNEKQYEAEKNVYDLCEASQFLLFTKYFQMESRGWNWRGM